MMADLSQLKTNPLSAIEIAVGDPAPKLTSQNPEHGIILDQVYSSDVTRFILKKARFSRYVLLVTFIPISLFFINFI